MYTIQGRKYVSTVTKVPLQSSYGKVQRRRWQVCANEAMFEDPVFFYIMEIVSFLQ